MASRHPITCHILDTTRGKPAADVECSLFRLGGLGDDGSSSGYSIIEEPIKLGTAVTDGDGRIARWSISSTDASSKTDLDLVPGVYKIRFETSEYFKREAGDSTTAGRTFFPFIEIMFIVENPPDKHYHVPLLLSNYSYSTYRGS